MKNLKKVLSLVLALAMALSLMTVAFAKDASDYTDYGTITNKEAVDVLTALEVIDGMGNNTFQPTGNVTRAQMAKMITIICLGNVDPTAFLGTQTDLKDINGHWAEAYIKYCYSQGIISGRGNGVFDPNANVTSAEASKMLLTAIGYNAKVQGYTGPQWAINVTRDAQMSGFYEDVSVPANQALTRDQAAQMMYNAVQAKTIVKTSSISDSGEVTYHYNSTGAPLLSKTFGCVSAKGYLTTASYDSDKKVFTYTVETAVAGGTTASSGNDASGTPFADAGNLKSTTDYSDLYGREVKVLWSVDKDGVKNVYGVYATDNAKAATAGELETVTGEAKKAELAGTTYNLEDTWANIPVYVFDGADMAANGNLGTVATNFDEASALTLVDDDDNGKYDYAIVLPATVAKVTYVGTKSITAGAAYTFEDNNIYAGVAKDDFAKIVAAGNTVYGKAVITKVESVEGTVSAKKETTDLQINGTWYKNANGCADGSDVGDTVKLAVVGGYYYNVEVVKGKSLDNVLMVLDAGAYSEGLATGAEAKVMYAADGKVATVKVSKVGGVEVSGTANVGTGKTYTTNGQLLVGAMYTFVEKDGALELTQLTDDIIGDTELEYTDNTSYTFKHHATRPTVGGMNIADDAVVMIYYAGANAKSSYITGAALKNWKTDWGDYTMILAGVVNGVKTAQVIALYDDDATIPGSTGSTGYGYVTGTTYYTEDSDKTPYAVMDIWTADGQLTAVKAESAYQNDGSTLDTAPDKADVSSYNAYAKGSFVTFEKLSNGNIGEVKAITGGTDAIKGMYVDKDGETVLNLLAGSKNITKDTVIVYVDTENVTGAEGGELALAQETAVAGSYVKNVVVYDKPTADGDLEVIFVDINNNLDSNAGTFTVDVGGGLSGVGVGTAAGKTTTFYTNGQPVAVANVKVAASASTNEVAFVGALAVEVVKGSAASVGTNLVAGNIIRVVAQDGTVTEYTVNTGAINA